MFDNLLLFTARLRCHYDSNVTTDDGHTLQSVPTEYTGIRDGGHLPEPGWLPHWDYMRLQRPYHKLCVPWWLEWDDYGAKSSLPKGELRFRFDLWPFKV